MSALGEYHDLSGGISSMNWGHSCGTSPNALMIFPQCPEDILCFTEQPPLHYTHVSGWIRPNTFSRNVFDVFTCSDHVKRISI